MPTNAASAGSGIPTTDAGPATTLASSSAIASTSRETAAHGSVTATASARRCPVAARAKGSWTSKGS